MELRDIPQLLAVTVNIAVFGDDNDVASVFSHQVPCDGTDLIINFHLDMNNLSISI